MKAGFIRSLRVSIWQKHKRCTLDTLIAIEWDTLRDLKRMLSNLELSTGEKNRLANALV
jgi:hypothetical protein